MMNIYYICHDPNSHSSYSVFQGNTYDKTLDTHTLCKKVKGTPTFRDWSKADAWLRANLEVTQQ